MASLQHLISICSSACKKVMKVQREPFFLLNFMMIFGKTSCLQKSMRLLARRPVHMGMVGSKDYHTPGDLNEKNCPKEPINYGKLFSISESLAVGEKLILEEMNEHPLDSKLTFDAAAHKYYHNNVPMDLSVTEVVGQYFETFDADLVVKKMMNGNNWPRQGYTQKDGTPYTENEIKEKWDSIGEYARNKGTWMHYNIERYLNNLTVSPKADEIPKFLNFYDDVIMAKKIQPFRTEWRIAAPSYSIAGSVDFVGRFPDGTYALIDWKRAKDLGNNLDNKYNRRGKFPLDHLDDCDGSKYFLQLNIYRHILEEYYGIRVSYMAVTSFHPDTGDTYFSTEVPRWENEVENVFNQIQESRQRKPEMSPPRTQPQEIPF